MRQIIYFDTLNKEYNSEVLSSVSDFTNSKIEIVHSWPSLMSSLASESLYELVLVLFNKDLLNLPGTTLHEIVDALTTISVISGSKKINVGIVINDLCEQSFVLHLKKSNINGIVPSLKTFGIADFYEALDILLAGMPHWPEAYIQPKVKTSTRQSVEYGIRLTERQREIMALIANRGLSNKKIAQILNISESTVKVHISSILKAYGVRNRTQLALAGNRGLHA